MDSARPLNILSDSPSTLPHADETQVRGNITRGNFSKEKVRKTTMCGTMQCNWGSSMDGSANLRLYSERGQSQRVYGHLGRQVQVSPQDGPRGKMNIRCKLCTGRQDVSKIGHSESKHRCSVTVDITRMKGTMIQSVTPWSKTPNIRSDQ